MKVKCFIKYKMYNNYNYGNFVVSIQILRFWNLTKNYKIGIFALKIIYCIFT